MGVVDPPSGWLDLVKESRIRPWRRRIQSRDDRFVGERAPGIRPSSSRIPTGFESNNGAPSPTEECRLLGVVRGRGEPCPRQKESAKARRLTWQWWGVGGGIKWASWGASPATAFLGAAWLWPATTQAATRRVESGGEAWGWRRWLGFRPSPTALGGRGLPPPGSNFPLL